MLQRSCFKTFEICFLEEAVSKFLHFLVLAVVSLLLKDKIFVRQLYELNTRSLEESNRNKNLPDCLLVIRMRNCLSFKYNWILHILIRLIIAWEPIFFSISENNT